MRLLYKAIVYDRRKILQIYWYIFIRAEPSLAEMTKKAIKMLQRSPDGYFLFVEGRPTFKVSREDYYGIIEIRIMHIAHRIGHDCMPSFCKNDINSILYVVKRADDLTYKGS